MIGQTFVSLFQHKIKCFFFVFFFQIISNMTFKCVFYVSDRILTDQ